MLNGSINEFKPVTGSPKSHSQKTKTQFKPQKAISLIPVLIGLLARDARRGYMRSGWQKNNGRLLHSIIKT